MNDEGVGMSGWLFADLALVLSVIFLAIVPGVDPARSNSTPTPTPTPSPTPVVDQRACLPQSNFQFDQIVVRDVRIGEVTWEKIANGQVREKLTKAEESGFLTAESLFSSSTAAAYLAKQEADGFSIALTETFGWVTPGDDTTGTVLAHEVNRVFRAGIDGQRSPGLSSNVFLYPLKELDRWSSAYLAKNIDADTARINLFFVRQPSPGCKR